MGSIVAVRKKDGGSGNHGQSVSIASFFMRAVVIWCENRVKGVFAWMDLNSARKMSHY